MNGYELFLIFLVHKSDKFILDDSYDCFICFFCL